ncbi:MAG TPA: uroporphyrinogen-III synthase [Polyangia bacterium]|nr:uroporphyrinogen-III synthase [Polyangia bacterium]
MTDPGAAESLSGWRVLVTRPREQAAPLAAVIRALGGEPVIHPTIELAPPPSWDALDAALSRLSDYAWIVFTSPSAARATCGRAEAHGARARLGDPRIAAVGVETARALRALGLRVDLIPDEREQRQEGLVSAFAAAGVGAGARVLFPQAVGGRELLREVLAARGCVVDVVPVSQTLPVRGGDAPPDFDAATFASPSALRAFVESWGAARLESAAVAVIGPTTADAARALGVRVDAMPSTPSMPALAHALAAHRRGR